jgi:hypothetical protein
MSEVLKMGIACSVDCLSQAGLSQPDAIIVGTSMGCCTHTKSFLDKIESSNNGPLSPTAFILSTHNTIAGQISLHLKNHGYNMTHTQNSVSFEQAIIDGMLCFNEGLTHVLVGAADESEEALYNIKERLGLDDVDKAMGASFFILSGNDSKNSAITLVDVLTVGLCKELSPHILNFIEKNKFLSEDIDLILYSSSNETTLTELKSIFDVSRLLDFQKFSGIWLTNSAFAMAYAVDLLSLDSHPSFERKIRSVLICNNLIPENLGLILLTNNLPISTH